MPANLVFTSPLFKTAPHRAAIDEESWSWPRNRKPGKASVKIYGCIFGQFLQILFPLSLYGPFDGHDFPLPLFRTTGRLERLGRNKGFWNGRSVYGILVPVIVIVIFITYRDEENGIRHSENDFKILK